jgi:DNA-binding PadR family transcriptional regulator
VVSSWDLSDTGPAKRLYRLTPEGRRCLGRWVETLTGYHRAIGELLALLKPGGKTPASGRARKCGCRKE